MDAQWSIPALSVFCLALLATFFVAWKGRLDAGAEAEKDITQQSLNRWFVGLSAGATANSGFVVTGAVGLGYSFGLYWILLPFGWFLGQLICWRYFPHRITAYGKRTNSTTLRDIITHGMSIGRFHPLALASSVIVIVCLGGYTMAQWVAGQKFLDGAFGLSRHVALLIIAALIVSYSALGQFRGSVYADTFQAGTRLLGTFVALGAVCWVAISNRSAFAANIHAAGDGFLSLLGGGSLLAALGFVIGYAAAAFGYGLGQPQITSRYLAARDPGETLAAKWISIGYVQLTWATMTIFGVLLRGVMPGIEDPEKGLTIFVAATLPAVVVGLIIADIFGAIASTANSLLVAMAQATRDLFRQEMKTRWPLWPILLVEGIATMVAAALLAVDTTVFELAVTSVTLMAAGLAPAVAIRVLGLRHSVVSITVAVYVGFGAALIWSVLGLSEIINGSAVGIPLAFLANRLLCHRGASKKTSAT